MQGSATSGLEMKNLLGSLLSRRMAAGPASRRFRSPVRRLTGCGESRVGFRRRARVGADPGFGSPPPTLVRGGMSGRQAPPGIHVLRAPWRLRMPTYAPGPHLYEGERRTRGRWTCSPGEWRGSGCVHPAGGLPIDSREVAADRTPARSRRAFGGVFAVSVGKFSFVRRPVLTSELRTVAQLLNLVKSLVYRIEA